MRQRWMIGTAAAMVTMAALIGGCDASKTETGYTPRKVGMNNSELRSLYAPAFSPEAHAEQEKKSDVSSHRPGT